MTSTADGLELTGLFLSALAIGCWLVVIKLGLDDEASRREKGLNGLLKIQSYTNLLVYGTLLALSALDAVPFLFLLRIPPPPPSGDPVRDASVFVIRFCLIASATALAVLSVVFVQTRSALDRYQARHGPHNRRQRDPDIPDPPAISPVHGPL